ncbi:MAG: acyl-CoA synthetase (AMP-forming)/AMP-acid ligase [Actinomycetia bacterium]|nr:acyl-CoA synthetase (AMP-forming)/AMP-acid ligase [Actinomycetes bacterium]
MPDGSDYSFARAWHDVATIAPERIAIACGDRHLSYGAFDERAEHLARFLRDAGVRANDKVAIQCVNGPEYLEAFYASLKLGAVPVNVNYRYVGHELAYLLENSDAVALVFHDEFAPTVERALQSLAPPQRPAVLVQVPHAGDRELRAGALDYETAIASGARGAPVDREPSGDDLVFLYTGGTTGYPKAVMWRSDDLYVSLWQMARPGSLPPDPAATARAGKQSATALPACPLMHGTGLFIALSTLAGGGKVVVLDDARLEPERVWQAVEREEVRVLTIVGDAFARPLLAALDDEPDRFDLRSLGAITSSGVTWSPDTKRRLLEHLPRVTLIDSLGASEGLMTRTETRGGDDIKPARFRLSDRIVVVTDDGDVVQPGDGQVGMLGVGGAIPLGYYKDEAKTATTFRTVAGRRYSIPGDYATVETDGSITLLGRGSACINTGGEKVYPEEVELVLRAHPDVFDCVVVGVPDERWGEMVVALVEPTSGRAPDGSALHAHCRAELAGYKRPKEFVLLPSLQRSPAGKADYKLLRDVAAKRMMALEEERS